MYWYMRQFFQRWGIKVYNLPFKLKLNYLVFRYKGAKNIPPDKLPKINLNLNQDDEENMSRVMAYAVVTKKMAALFPDREEQLATRYYMGLFLRSQPGITPDEYRYLEHLISVDNQPITVDTVLDAMVFFGDITEAQKPYYRSKYNTRYPDNPIKE